MSPRRKALAAGAAATLLLLAGIALRPGPRAPGASAPAARAVAVAPAAAPASVTAPVRPPPAVPVAAADSLRGTEVDGALHLDANGAAIADRDLRRLFDYFLARLGERTPAAIRDDLAAWLAVHAPPTAVAQVLAWFDVYVDVEQAHRGLVLSGDPQRDFEALRAVRQQRYGEALAEAWFGDEERYTAATYARLALAHDASVSPEQRRAREAEIDAGLAPAVAQERAASMDFGLAVAQTEQFAADGSDAATRHRERATLWGEAAATRLAQLDAQDAEWQRRLADYAAERARWMARADLDAAAREAGLRDLLAARFDATEQRRVAALAAAGLLP